MRLQAESPSSQSWFGSCSAAAADDPAQESTMRGCLIDLGDCSAVVVAVLVVVVGPAVPAATVGPARPPTVATACQCSQLSRS